MRLSTTLILGGVIVAAAASLGTARDGPGNSNVADGRDADRAAVRQTTLDFVQAFNRGDARAVANGFTETGEMLDDRGDNFVGRSAIEKAYTEFFKARPKSRIDVDIRSIRFLSRDTAIEEGVIRFTPSGTDHPTSSYYTAFQVRENGQWKTAHCREWGGDEDKLIDLTWLIGDWRAQSGAREISLSYAWNDKQTAIRCRFVVTENGKVTSSGFQNITLDPATGQIHSHTMDDDGTRGDAHWFRDGGRWVQESRSVLANGQIANAHNIIARLDDNHFIWRSVDRTVNGEPMMDTLPIRISRVNVNSGNKQ